MIGFGDQWECLTSGECFGHLSQCLDDAASKQTVISPQLRETLGPNYLKELNIEQLSSGNYRVISAAKMNSLVVRKMIKRRYDTSLSDHLSLISTHTHIHHTYTHTMELLLMHPFTHRFVDYTVVKC